MTDSSTERRSGPRHIAVEGPIGVGKTSLVNLLARKLEARSLLEAPEENPFIGKFYEDMERWAFQAQVFFLLSRYRQLQSLAQQNLFEGTVVSDYLFAKDKIFAYLTLDDRELPLYEQLYGLLAARLPKPDVVVYLQASTEVLMERIKLRSRDYETNLSKEYIGELNDAYNYYFFHYTETPLLVINTTSIDFVRSELELDDLVRQIQRLKGGMSYYTPLASR